MRHGAARPCEFPPRELSHPSIRGKSRSKRLPGRSRLLLLLLPLILAACGTDGPTSELLTVPDEAASDTAADPEMSDSVTARPDPEARPAQSELPGAVLLLIHADQLEHDGFWEDAVDARAAALADAASLAPEVIAEAYMAQIRLLLRLDRPAEAGVTLQELDRSDAATNGASLELLRGRVHTTLGQATEALAAYETYLVVGGPARHAALLERARLHTAIGDRYLALRDYSALRDDLSTPPLDLESALLEGGVILENDGRNAEADEWYQELARVSPWLSDDAFALHRSGAVRIAQGNLLRASEAWTTLLIEYPQHWRAVAAYDRLQSAGAAIPPLVEGLYLYRQFRYDDARAAYQSFLATDPAAAETAIARYYLAAIDEDAGVNSDAIEGYLASAGLHAEGDLADDALWWAARLFETDGSFGLARITYERLASEYPESSFGADADFRVGLLWYREGDLPAASAAFLARTSAQNPADAQRAELWLGKSLTASGDDVAAAEAYRTAAEQDPASYYGLRARANLDGTPAAPSLVLEPLPEELRGRETSEAWLRALTPEPPGAGGEGLRASPDWQAGLDLWRSGQLRAADARFRLALAQHDGPWTLYRAAQALDDLGATHLRLEAAVILLDTVPSAERTRAPAEVLRWAYPRGWPQLAAASAGNFAVDELLLYALIRQESRFNPDAGSIAGALGLTQVIPSTGGDIARALGDEAFAPDSLFRPHQSIRYGTSYLGAQLDEFLDAPWVALAAYNGGPSNATSWAEAGVGTDPDLFYEQITFSETRSYLELVFENYAWYQFIYRGGGGPKLVTTSDSATSLRASGSWIY
jgi:soluble lytic murein transglycosylase